MSVRPNIRERLRDVLWPPLPAPRTGESSPWRPWVFWAVVTAVFCGGVFVLEAAGVLVLTNPWPLVLLLLSAWVLRQHLARARRGWRARVALWSRWALIAAIALALAEPRAVRVDERLAMVFAVDHSASIERPSSDAAMKFVLNAVVDKPPRDEAGLVFFGRDAAVELPPRMSMPYETVNVQVDREGTDLAEALSLSAAMLPPGRQGRIVLVSDGVSTEGELDGVLRDLAARQVAVDVLPINYAAEREVWLERLDLPRTIKQGEPLEPAVVLSALQPGEGTLLLEVNGQAVVEQRVSFQAGKNRIPLRAVLPSPGFYDFTARLVAREGDDRWDRNNVAMASHYLQGAGRIMIVADAADGSDYTGALVQALVATNKVVEVVEPADVAADPLALLPYDLILFADVPRDAFDEQQLDALHVAVFDQGSGFLMLGGEDGYGPGGWAGSPIEDLLPLSTEIKDRKVLPKAALAIVLHTCEFNNGNEWAKRITKKAIQVLSPQDEVGILAYDYNGGDRWLAKLTAARNYATLARLVNNAQIGDMPAFGPTMQLALKGLKASNASAKSLLIISDSDPTPVPTALVNQFRAAQITISTVAINPHNPADTKVMQLMSQATGGRFYFPSAPEKLPAIFIKEAKQLRRSAIVNETFVPEVVFPSPILRGITEAPPLHGYTMTSVKPEATLILAVPSEEGDVTPLLARWRYGVGVTAAFTSDLGVHWGRDWTSWSRYAAFVNQLVEDLGRARKNRRLQVRSFSVRGEGIIQAEDYGDEEGLGDLAEVLATVETPSGQRTMRMEQVAPRRYELRFPLAGVGRYRAVVAAADAPPNEQEHTGFTVPFSQEFLRFRSDPIALDRIAEATGGRVLAGVEGGEELFGVDRETTSSSRSLIDWFLWILACWIPIDVALRRVQLDWASVRAWMGRRDEDRTEGLAALRRRKEQVGAGLATGTGGGERAPAGPAPSATELPAGVRPGASPSPGAGSKSKPATSPSDEDNSSMGRLLAAKRRAAQRPADDDADTSR